MSITEPTASHAFFPLTPSHLPLRRTAPLALFSFFPFTSCCDYHQVNAALKAGRGDSVMSFSHFLPRKQTLPDWLDPGEDEFRPEWLENSSPSTQVMFSRVAGSHIIDRQLRQLTKGVPGMGKKASVCKHIHAFGHSHRPKDFELQGAPSSPVAIPHVSKCRPALLPHPDRRGALRELSTGIRE